MSVSKPPSVNSSVYNGEYFAGVNITKADIGLSLVDDTSDMSKPVSTATSAAISAAVGAVTKATIGLGSVNDTSDLSKPISTLTAAGITGRAKLGSANTFTNTNVFTGSMSKGRELIAISTANAVDNVVGPKIYTDSTLPRIILYNSPTGRDPDPKSAVITLPRPRLVAQGTLVTIIHGGDAAIGGASPDNLPIWVNVTAATGGIDEAACTGGGIRINGLVYPTGGTNTPTNRLSAILNTFQTVTFYCVWGADPNANPSTAWWVMHN